MKSVSGKKILLIMSLLFFTGLGVAEITIDARTSSGTNLDNLDISIPELDREFDDVDRARFSPDSGTYNVFIDHDEYNSIERTIVVEEDEDSQYIFTMGEASEIDSSVSLESLEVPESVCSRTNFRVDVDVVNSGDKDEVVSLTGQGFGQIFTGKAFVVPEGESRTYRYTFTDISGLGLQNFEVSINGMDESISDDIRLRDCDLPGDPQQVENIDLELYPERGNEKASVGELVRVRGFIDGVRDSVPVDITVDGITVSELSTQPDGFFETYFRPKKSGEVTVTANSGNEFDTEELNVVPVAKIEFVEAPNQVFEGDTIEACAEINSGIEADTVLLDERKVIESKSGNGELCYDIQASEPGENDYTLRALTYGGSDSEEFSVNVLPQGSEVETFPGQIESIESEGGLIRISLYNTNPEARNYTVNLRDVPEDWMKNTTQNTLLESGERENIYFYTSPKASGNFEGVVEVESEEEIIYSDMIDFRIIEKEDKESYNMLMAFFRLLTFWMPF